MKAVRKPDWFIRLGFSYGTPPISSTRIRSYSDSVVDVTCTEESKVCKSGEKA